MITIPTGDLVGILNDTIPFAFTDDDLPMLNCIRLEWDGTQLHALATDRYRVGISTWIPGDVDPGAEIQDDLFTSWGSGDDPWSMTIALDEAKELVKVFKLPTKEGHTPVTADYDPQRWTLKVVRARETGHSAITVTAPDMRHEFPDVRHLMAESKPAPADEAGYTARYMADFAKVRPMGPLVLTFGESLTLVRIGERFVGAIMPVRLAQPAEAVAS